MNLADLNDLCTRLGCNPRDFTIHLNEDIGVIIYKFPFNGTGDELSSKVADLGVEILMSSAKNGRGEFWI